MAIKHLDKKTAVKLLFIFSTDKRQLLLTQKTTYLKHLKNRLVYRYKYIMLKYFNINLTDWKIR